MSDPTRYGRDILALAYIGVFGVYWLWSCGAMWFSLREAWEIRRFYELELKILGRELRTLKWNEVVMRLGDLQRCGRAPWKAFQIAAGAVASRDTEDIEMAPLDSTPDTRGKSEGAVITAHDVACRIMRKENYLIAMLNANILDLTLPLPMSLAGRSALLDTSAARARLTKTLEWSLHLCLMDHIFSQRFIIRRTFLDDELALRRRFISAGLIHVALVPFVAVFMVMHFFLLHAQDWHDKKHYLGPREWSPVAQWSFRELNELPHVFEKRIAASREPADAYLKLFPQPIVVALARCLAFVSGAIVTVLLALAAALDSGDAILLYVKLGDRNLLWYAGAASAVFAISRAFVPTDEEKNTSVGVDTPRNRTSHAHPGGYNAGDNTTDMDAEVIMQRIAEHTHCFPEEWRGQAHTHDVRDAFACAFRYKAWLFFDEVTSVVFAPLVLCFSLPSSAPTILKFIRDNTVDVDGLGSVLGHSLFDFDTYGDTRYGSPINGAKPMERGKMEKSFLNFTLNYPEWAASDERSAHFFKNVKDCASTPRTNPSDKEADRFVIKNAFRPHCQYPTDELLGLSFERLDQYAASKKAARQLA